MEPRHSIAAETADPINARGVRRSGDLAKRIEPAKGAHHDFKYIFNPGHWTKD
jgi:hypothetical protein